LWVFVCCQVEASATDWPLVQRRPTECGVPECDLETSKKRRPGPGLDFCPTGEDKRKVTSISQAPSQDNCYGIRGESDSGAVFFLLLEFSPSQSWFQRYCVLATVVIRDENMESSWGRMDKGQHNIEISWQQYAITLWGCRKLDCAATNRICIDFRATFTSQIFYCC
jgi:hypothetical protein